MAHQVSQGSQVPTGHEIVLGKPMPKRVRIGPPDHPGPLLQTLQHLIDPADCQLLACVVGRKDPIRGPVPGLPDSLPHKQSIPRPFGKEHQPQDVPVAGRRKWCYNGLGWEEKSPFGLAMG